jgi:putative FmdB family regulatory protein
MPIYEYKCKKCHSHIEAFQKLADKPLVKCRKCGGRLEKLLSAPAIQFKGAGWYVTDYAGKGKKTEGAEEKGTAATESSKKKSKEGSPAKKTSDTSSSKPPAGD